jgi:hypothetical protein
MQCVQCKREVDFNRGTEENPLCPACFRMMEKEYAPLKPVEYNDQFSILTQFSQKNIFKGLFFLAVIGGFLWFVVSMGKDNDKNPRPEVGDKIVLTNGHGNIVFLAETKADYDELTKYASAEDSRGITGMVLSGRAFRVSDSTKALMLGYDAMLGSLYEVRIISGDENGRKGYVLREAAHRI